MSRVSGDATAVGRTGRSVPGVLPAPRPVCVFPPAGSHDITSMRDMRDALGALGPVAGQNPELNNLTLSMTQVSRRVR